MTENEMLKISVEEFSRLQDYMLECDKESSVYKKMKRRYIYNIQNKIMSALIYCIKEKQIKVQSFNHLTKLCTYHFDYYWFQYCLFFYNIQFRNINSGSS